jgi:hypothetical protein
VVRQVRDAFAALLDQSTPFGRLALTHVVCTAGDTLVAISLAGSLFFSISTKAAQGKVILYLVLTMAPFAVVAPLLGPVIDRSRGARRATVAVSCAGRAVMCLIMAGDLKSLLMFPEAFTLLVLSKVYLVTKGSLVPLVVRTPTAAVTGGGAEDTAAPRAPGRRSKGGGDSRWRRGGAEDNPLATANARLGLLASLTGLVAALPAIAVLKLLGGPWVLRLDMVVFVVGTVVALRLPVGRRLRGWAPDGAGAGPATSPLGAPAPGSVPVPGTGPAPGSMPAPEGAWDEETPLGALGPAVNTHPEVILALSAMSILRGLVGFLTFLLAFSLRRMHTSHVTEWLGFMLAASTAGGILGVLIVPRARRVLAEVQMLALSIWSVALAGALAAFVGAVAIQALLAFVIGLASAAAKPAFDALVQRYVPTAAQGRAFARFETRLQLVWVLGALLPVVANLPLVSGDVVIAAVAAVSGLSYLTSRRALRHRWVGP